MDCIENNTWVRGNTLRVLNAFVFMFNTRNKSGISKHPCIFLFIACTCFVCSVYMLFINIKCSEAMIGDCLKSDTFHM